LLGLLTAFLPDLRRGSKGVSAQAEPAIAGAK